MKIVLGINLGTSVKVIILMTGFYMVLVNLSHVIGMLFMTPVVVTIHAFVTNVYCLFGVLRRFQHYTGHITTGSWKGRGNQYIEFARVVYCKLPTNGKQLPAFPLTAMTGIKPRQQRWEARVLPLCHRGPLVTNVMIILLGHK